MKLVRAILFLVQSIWAILTGYLIFLTVNALRAPRRTKLADAPRNRFLFLIPAHNEEKLIASAVENLAQLDYPPALYEIHVIADNCTDQTAQLARSAGAMVHERFNEIERGKGYALQWALHEIWNAQTPHDAMVILDADSIVSPNFARVMDARLTNGERVIQAYYAVRNPGESSGASLRYAALAVLHFVRPQGRMAMGWSAGLKGNGMVFAADVLRQHTWSASLTEDIEFHMELLLGGQRVTFAPDAVVEAEMPGTLAGAQTQNVRWERGRLEMAKRYVPQLLSAGVKRKNFMYWDAAMEHLIPPFSILAGVSALLFGAQVGLKWCERRSHKHTSNAGITLATSSILNQVVYLFAGLWLVRAPRQIYIALLGAPLFIVWKIWLYVRVLMGRDKQGWVRTARNK